jgi:hypothetical protein
MPTQPTPDSTLLSIDSRLRHVESQVTAIHAALVGSVDGQHKGLQARVEKLESWARWLGGLVTMAIGAALTALVRGH